MNNTIANASNRPLYVQAGSIPDVGGTLRDWFQPMFFSKVVKSTAAFQVIEISDQIYFWGVIQPMNARQLYIKPEGQRAWTWQTLHADHSLKLQVDDLVIYLCVQTRVMARRDYSIYGYVEYDLVQDWMGAGPTPDALDGGNAFTTKNLDACPECFNGGSNFGVVDGGDAFVD